MSLTVIWISRASAKLFHLSNEKMERKQFTPGRSELLESLFRDTVKEIAAVGRILLAGPDIAKHHFQAFLAEHHPMVGKRVVAIEAVEQPTDAAIAALARRYVSLWGEAG